MQRSLKIKNSLVSSGGIEWRRTQEAQKNKERVAEKFTESHVTSLNGSPACTQFKNASIRFSFYTAVCIATFTRFTKIHETRKSQTEKGGTKKARMFPR